MSKKTTTYPDNEQRKRWEANAEELGMSMSEFVESMVEAGMKSFEVSITPESSVGELRRQRDQCRQQLREAKSRIDDLESRLGTTEQAEIREFIKNNPGATFDEITQHIGSSVPARVSNHLEIMAGTELHEEDGTYYPFETHDK